MTDRELLEAAARAAGIEFGPKRAATGGPHLYLGPQGGWWNPITDDGDALRLAVRLGLVVDCSRPSAGPPFYSHTHAEVGMPDTAVATRRAIVRAAAAMALTDRPT